MKDLEFNGWKLKVDEQFYEEKGDKFFENLVPELEKLAEEKIKEMNQ